MVSRLGLGRTIGLLFGSSGIAALLISCGGGGADTPAGQSTPTINTKADLGKALFFDTSLSNPVGMSCGTCHATGKNFTDPRPGPTSPGAVKGLFGFRNSPSINYMAYSPTFNVSGGEGGGAIGGQFWDGHAPDLESQAKLPLLNPIEMNNPSAAAVVDKVKNGPLATAVLKLYGNSIFDNPVTAYNAIANAIAEFERLPAISPFSSKYDAFLKGKAQLTASEIRGLAVFNGKAGCSGCHTSSPAPDGTPPFFTNFCYSNLGLPKNPANPFYSIPATFNPLGSNFVDLGLQVTTGNPGDAGNFKTPSLRNVAFTAPYFHNGIFNTLDKVVEFYNKRDVGGFAPPEVPGTMNTLELGNLKLTAQESADIVSFLLTLNDGYTSTPQFQVKLPR